ncbi:hypothetical protein Tco_1333364 [Tanacetum coccineum]
MTEMFLLYEALALIATCFVTFYGCKALHIAGMWFCSLFPGHEGPRPLTTLYLGVLNIIGLLSFSFAPSNNRPDVFIFYSFLAISAHLAMMGLCSSHFIFADKFGAIVIFISPLYVLLMIFKPLMMSRLFGVPEPNPQAAPSPQTDRERLLESWAKQGAIYTTTTAIALLATDCSLGKRIEHTPTLIWIAVYNAGAFWAFQGALLLDRGRLFETWVLGGIIMSLSMTISGLVFIFTPTPQDINILFFCTVAVVSHHKYDWIAENIYDWFLGRQHPVADAHETEKLLF